MAGTERRGSGSVELLRRLLAALLAATTAAHVLRPRWYLPLIPAWVPGDREVVHTAATVAEGLSAALLSTRRTARAGGWLAAAVLVGVFPANVQAALDGGYRGIPGWAGSATAAWLRLPLQLPLVAAAVVVARRGGRGRERDVRRG